MASQMRVYVPEHPLIKHWLGVARDATTPPVLFKAAMTELGRWLTYEATRYWFPTLDTTVQTPLGTAGATLINPAVAIAVVPILRAGLTLLEGAQTLLPLASIHHLGLVRDEQTLTPTCYLNHLPPQFKPQTHILLLDPMLATGGSIMTALRLLTERGADPALIRIIGVVAAPPALQKLSAEYPTLQVYAAMIDEGLNDQGYIVPGLGDAGDRAFGTFPG
ncbi:MAG: uracil phosphoribosyltransferase [Microcystaceae cyanobacterium]